MLRRPPDDRLLNHVYATLAHTQDDNPIKHVWHPEPNHKGNSPPGLQNEDKGTGIISHHEVLARLEAYDTDRGESSLHVPAYTQVSRSLATAAISSPTTVST